jgi:hypothetical protein
MACDACGSTMVKDGVCQRCGTLVFEDAPPPPRRPPTAPSGPAASSQARPMPPIARGTPIAGQRPYSSQPAPPMQTPAPSQPRRPAPPPEPEPVPLDLSTAIVGIPDDGGPPPVALDIGQFIVGEPPEDRVERMEGFEATRVDQVEGPLRAQVHSTALITTACPSCGTALADAGAAFCDACGQRIPRMRKREDAPAQATKSCRRCKFKNPVNALACKSCGLRLSSG